MKNWIVLLTFLLAGSVEAKTATSTLEFYNGAIHYKAERSKDRLSFHDQIGTRQVLIEKCNQKAVDEFWGQIVNHTKSLQSKSPMNKRLPASAMWLKYEGLQYSVFPFERARPFFNNLPEQFLILSAESLKLCRK